MAMAGQEKSTAPLPRRPGLSLRHVLLPKLGLTGWSLFLWPPLVIMAFLLVVPQAAFILTSLYRNDGMGGTTGAVTLANYIRILSDPFYLNAIWLTFWLSAVGTLIGLVLAVPTAYALARMHSGVASGLVAVLLMTSFINVVVKIPGLTLLFSGNGLINRGFLALGLVDAPVKMLDNEIGVLIGLVQYTLAFLVIMVFAAIQTVPRKLEDAAHIHGATWAGGIRQVVLPIASPGIIAGALIAFNMHMGAFTSAALMGGGRVLTLPVLIQRKVMLETDYAMGAALSTVLLAFVVLVNIIVGRFVTERGRRHG